jgi:hypothetical protein
LRRTRRVSANLFLLPLAPASCSYLSNPQSEIRRSAI